MVLHDAVGQIDVGCLGRVLRRLAKWAQDGDQTQVDEEKERRDLTERVVEHTARLGERVGLRLLLIVLLVLRKCVIEEVDDGLGRAYTTCSNELAGGIAVAKRKFEMECDRMDASAARPARKIINFGYNLLLFDSNMKEELISSNRNRNNIMCQNI